MPRRSLLPRFVLVVAGLVAACGIAHAYEDDFEFAQALADRGYTDLAEQQFRALLSDPKRSAKEKAEGQYGLAIIKRIDALAAARETSERRRRPLKEVLDLFRQADAAIASFIEANAAHQRVLEAKLDRANLITDRANYINLAIERGWLPADVSEGDLQKEVAQGYDTAISLLQAVQDKAKKDVEGKALGTEEYEDAQERLGLVWLHRIVALYGKGAALPRGDTSGVAALNAAISEVTDYLWSFDGTLRGLWASYYGGLANWKLDRTTDAVRDMGDVTGYVSESDGVPAARGVSLQAYEMLGTIALDAADRKGEEELARTALARLDRLPGQWPTYLDDAAGQRAAVSRARLLARAQRTREAIELLQNVLKKADEKHTGVDGAAGELLAELLTSTASGGVKLDPALLNRIAIAKWRDGDYPGAIRAFQGVIGACRTPEQRDEFAWDAWDYIGRCYGIEERWYEAFLAFDAIEKAWQADQKSAKLAEITQETGWNRAQVVGKLGIVTKDAAESARLKAWAKELLDEFARNHPESPRNQGAELQAATEKLRDAQGMRRTGDYAGALAKYDEAIAALTATDKGSSQIDKVEALIAQARRETARCLHEQKDDAGAVKALDEALRLSRAWLAKQRPAAEVSTVRQARAAGESIALTNILTALAEKADYVAQDQRKAVFEELLKEIDAKGADFLRAVSRGQTLLDQWRTEALIGTDQVEKAEKLLQDLLAKDPDLANGPYLAALVARALETEANTWLDKGDEGRYRTLMLRSARLREYAITKAGDPSPESYLSLASTFRKSGDLEKAEEYYRKAQEAYAGRGDDERARAVRLELINLLVDQRKFEDAIRPLEVELVPDQGARLAVLDRLAKDDSLTKEELEKLLETMSRNRRVLDVLARAYVEAARDDKDLLRSVNLTNVLLYCQPDEDKYGPDWVEYQLRLSTAYFKYGALKNDPEAFKKVERLIQTRLVVQNLLDTCNQLVPGSKKKFEDLLARAKSGGR